MASLAPMLMLNIDSFQTHIVTQATLEFLHLQLQLLVYHNLLQHPHQLHGSPSILVQMQGELLIALLLTMVEFPLAHLIISLNQGVVVVMVMAIQHLVVFFQSLLHYHQPLL